LIVFEDFIIDNNHQNKFITMSPSATIRAGSKKLILNARSAAASLSTRSASTTTMTTTNNLLRPAAIHVGAAKMPSQVIKNSTALFSALSDTKFTLPDLPYDYGALEPAISAETMTLHHSKHHSE
jgi:Iron/manganese superoxide dismutases, alpha-hairpin domain